MLRTSEFILNFVLNSAWQIAVIFALAAPAARLLRNGPARYRYTLWMVALSVSLIVPLLTITRFVPDWISESQPFAVVPSSTRIENAAPVLTKSDLEAEPVIDRTAGSRQRVLNTQPRSVLVLALVYFLFIGVRAIRLVRFWRRKEALRRSASSDQIPFEVEAVARRCRELLQLGDVRVAVSNAARVPYTIGALRPLIVLPPAFCRAAGEAQLLSVVGHEMAHVKRRDFLTNLLCELIALLISFHPLTWLIKRELDRARELACDELVTTRILTPKIYARSLLWAADVTRQYSSQAFMLSIFDGKILEERIKKLMRNNQRIGPRMARVMIFTAVALMTISALSLSMFSLQLQTTVRAAVTQTTVAAAPETTLTPLVSSGVPQQQLQTPIQENAASADARAMEACNAGKRGDEAAIPSLISMLGDDTKTQPIRCWDTGRWSPALHTFKHPSPGEQAAIALASFGRPAFEPLTQQLTSSNATVRRNAAWAIGELTNMRPGQRAGAVPSLINLLADSDQWVRMASARALGELRDERALTRLIATLSDDDWHVRQLVVWALSEMKDDRAVTALCQVLLSDTRVEVRRGAADALGEIASAEALPALRQALNDTGEGIRAKAAWAISEIEG